MDKLKLSYVNGGKPFKLPKMTMEKQEEVMEQMVKLEEKLEGEKFNREVNKFIMLKTLKEIDDSVTIDNINKMHPDDFIFLFGKIYDEGRELVSDATDFRKEKKTSEVIKKN